MPRVTTLAILLALGLGGAPAAAPGVFFGDRTECAVTAEGNISESDIKVICGIPPDPVREMMKLS